MKTSKCRWCGQTVKVSQNQRMKPHMIGAQKCVGSGYWAMEAKLPSRAKWNKKKRVLRWTTI